MGNCIGRVSNDNESDYLQFGLFNAYQQYRLTIENIAEQLKHAKEIQTLAKALTKGGSIRHLSTELRNEKSIVLQAVKKNPRAIHYASQLLQNDPDIEPFIMSQAKRPHR